MWITYLVLCFEKVWGILFFLTQTTLVENYRRPLLNSAIHWLNIISRYQTSYEVPHWELEFVEFRGSLHYYWYELSFTYDIEQIVRLRNDQSHCIYMTRVRVFKLKGESRHCTDTGMERLIQTLIQTFWSKQRKKVNDMQCCGLCLFVTSKNWEIL